MGKKSYRATSVNNIKANELQEHDVREPLTVGVDVAKEKFVAAFVERLSGRVIRTVRWSHPAETPIFIELLTSLAEPQVALESTGRYGDVFVYHLRLAGVPVYSISTKRVHDAAEEYDGVPSKHDGKDAAIIGDLHRRGKTHPLREMTPQMRQLQACTATMLRLKSHYLTNINRLEAELARFWPELTQHLAIQTKTVLRLLATYGTPNQVARDLSGAEKCAMSASKGRVHRERLNPLLASAGSTRGVVPVSAETRMVQLLAGDALRGLEALAEAAEEVRAAVKESPSTERLADAVGPTTAAVLTAKSGDAANFKSSRAWVKNLGLNLKESSSGASGQRGVHISKRGASASRQYLHLAALRLIRFNPIVRSWYAHQCSRPGAVKLCVVVKLTRKLAMALPHVARGAAFDVEKLFDTSLFPHAALEGHDLPAEICHGEGVEAA